MSSFAHPMIAPYSSVIAATTTTAAAISEPKPIPNAAVTRLIAR